MVWDHFSDLVPAHKMQREITFVVAVLLSICWQCSANLAPVFTKDMNGLALYETTPVGTVVYRLEGFDPEGSEVRFGLAGTDHFSVDPVSGNVTLVKEVDREDHETLSFLVSIKDRVNISGDSEDDNIVSVPISVIVLDENDNVPAFEGTPYETEVQEDAEIGQTIFDKIVVRDIDTVGEILNISCVAQVPDVCSNFKLRVLENTQALLRASVILNTTLNYNLRTIYHFQLAATDGKHTSVENFEARVKDIQNSPPIFQGSLSAVIDEDSPIGSLVLKVQARDGDNGEPRKIVYDLLSNPMEYFLLDHYSGELRTAKPLDKEALSDTTGLITLIVQARELIDGIPGSDNLTTSLAQISITIRDVNDSPPTFNKKEYAVSLIENTTSGTPLALEMNVTDRDVGVNSIFSLRLEDVSGVFEIEPQIVNGFSQVNVRVGNGTLDYENPNQRKFIVLVIAEETETNPKLSSTATITVSVLDANDNKPVFDQESYSVTVLESAKPGQFITAITAKDIDSGSYGEMGIKYSLSGTGAYLFDVNPKTGVITLADCHEKRQKRDLPGNSLNSDENYTKINVTTDGSIGVMPMDNNLETGVEYITYSQSNETNDLKSSSDHTNVPLNGEEYCLDYETQTTYFLSYKATDDEGKGQTSVVSLKISVLDANDTPPVCESAFYRASIDEGAKIFDPPLVVKARDIDTVSDISYSIVGDTVVRNLFEIDKRSGQITIKPNISLDVNILKADFVSFDVEANDGVYAAKCKVNITIRDVNNHAPTFSKDLYEAVIVEDLGIGAEVQQVEAHDLDSGINAEIRYRIQHGSYDDFRIEPKSGMVLVARKLDYDRRNTYEMEILAVDLGTPSLSGTATLVVHVSNSNDKDPYFTPSTQRAEIREDARIGSVVHNLIAIDPDVDSVDALEFAATEPITAIDKDGNEVDDFDDLRSYFSVSRNGTVSLNRKLDRDIFAVLRITVLVTDSTAPTIQQGSGMLIISVIDVNEVAPQFLPPWSPKDPVIKLQILEEQPIGNILTTLQAVDEDSAISEYRLEDNPYFEINGTSGEIRTKARLDYEAVREVKLLATVVDAGVPQLTSTAELLINIININDNEPYFDKKEYNFNVLENSSKGTVVGKVSAKDDDAGGFGEITYRLQGDYSKHFHMDPDAGIIMVANSSFLDREKISLIYLSAVAEDKAPITTRKSAIATVLINVLDINDNPPIFSQTEYTSTVAENAAVNPPAALLQIKAEDADEGIFGEVRYFIISGNEENLFHLEPVTGILYPRQSLVGKTGTYELVVEARDGVGAGPFTSMSKIVIIIFSVNQHRPVFIMPASTNATVEIPKDEVEENYLVMTLKATDHDTGDNGRVTYHLQVNNAMVQETDEFFVNETTGELRTKIPLLRNKQAKYDLILVARDQGSQSQFETLRFLTVILVDINENRPEFPEASNPYKMFIQENNDRDVRVGKIQAHTKSKRNANDVIYYYMLLGNEDGAFYVDKTNGDVFANKSLDREKTDFYNLYILASRKSDLHISDTERATFSIKRLEHDHTVAKVWITVLDVNDNKPEFDKTVYYAGVNTKASLNEFITLLNATDKDYGSNATIEYFIAASNLYKFGSTKSTGSIVPSPFAVSKEGRLTTTAFMAEYNQDRFELEIIAREVEPPQRFSKAHVYIWIFESSQLVRVILSRPPAEVHKEQDEIVAELGNATKSRIVIDEIRYHVDSMGRIRVDWCDLFFHAVDINTQQIISVDDILKIVDSNYDYWRDYYAGFAIQNVVPAYIDSIQEEFDLALAGLVALIIVLFVGVTSFIVLCCCLKHWNLSLPMENFRSNSLIKKQIIEDLNTTENPLWIEQKLKLYEEQELTMQVFSEPEQFSNLDTGPDNEDRRGSLENSHAEDSNYATIQLRNATQIADIGDYATLRNNRAPSIYDFTGSTFQAPIREQDDVVTELI